MVSSLKKIYCFLLFTLSISACGLAQTTIPWSASLNITFGKGPGNPGPPLQTGFSEFIYTTDPCPAADYYTIVNKVNCPDLNSIQGGAGHLFFGPHPDTDSGYFMLINYPSLFKEKIVFADTVTNLCSNNTYLFWAAILKLSQTCQEPNFTFRAETISGQLIQSFQTGNIGGSPDNYSGYSGYYGVDMKATFPYYYGFSFTLPAGINSIVVKIIANPTGHCGSFFAIDNILLSPVGPGFTITTADNNPNAWVTGACFQNGKPVVLNGSINQGYLKFGTSDFVSAVYTNPAVQWQQSTDDGYTWTDIPGETNLKLSHVFSIPDTFFIRLRGSESVDFNNPNCNVQSNVIQVQVDGIPSNYKFTSNSPVCTDADLIFSLEGGASYTITGPNGYFDNTPFPHIYNPALNDSGWYYAQIISYGGCSVADSVFAKIIGPDVKISNDQSICYGEKAQLQASGGNIYMWSPGAGLSDINIANPLASPIVTTKYQVKVIDGTGCSAHASVTIKLLDSILKASITGPDVVCPKDIALFKDASTGSIAAWNWDFGNGNTSTAQNPPAQNFLEVNGIISYPVKLAVTDTSGCTDTTLMMVKSVNNCYITVPSAFTPNNDGHNDYLYPLNAYKASNLIFRVYNRNGQLVFETRDWTKKWDGMLGSAPQPAGAYVWTLEYIDPDNKMISLKGTTVLIR